MHIKNLTQNPLVATHQGNIDQVSTRCLKRLARYLLRYGLPESDRTFLKKLGNMITESQRMRVVAIADRLNIKVKGWLA